MLDWPQVAASNVSSRERRFLLLLFVWPRISKIKRPDALWVSAVFGTVAGLLLPVILILIGWLAQLIIDGGRDGLPERLLIGPLSLSTHWLNAGDSVLRAVLGLVALLIIVTSLLFIAWLANQRAAAIAALDYAIDIQRCLFKKSGALAIVHGLSGQQAALREMQQSNIPQLRDALQQWARAFPRSAIKIVALTGLACAIQPWFTLLAVVCLLILWTLHGYVDAAWRKRRPVLFERSRALSEQLSYLCDTAPLLATIHDSDDTANGYEAQLHAYRATGLQLSDASVWKSPTMLVGYIVTAALLTVVLAIRCLDATLPLLPGETATLLLAILFAVMAVFRLYYSYRRYRSVEPTVRKLDAYLEQATPNLEESASVAPAKLSNHLVLDHVTFKDSVGQKLLEDISLVLRPGQVTAIIASERVQAKALAELLLGFGRPASGRILMDEKDSTDIDPRVFRAMSLWISASGPLVHGSIESNLWTDVHPDATIDLMEIARRAHVADAILNLVDGLATLVTPTDDRLQPDHLFRLGVARGLLKKPTVVVAEEPTVRVKASTENDTLQVMQLLKSENAIVAVLPSRIGTLREADQIVVLHEHRIVSVGTHAQLLESSEIYRHLTYMRFAAPLVGG